MEDKLVHEFRDYFNYQEQLGRVPPHRVLAINRGERARVLRVKVDMDTAEMGRMAEELLVPADHPHGDFLRGCVRDALARLVIPSLEREVRREMTENAETHAVEVFAKNLRNLLLQPPVRNRRLVAIDPGFKSGCKIAVLDEFGSLLDHTVIQIIGKAERRQEGRAKLVELIRKHSTTVLAIGNGTACRETEELVAELLGDELKDDGVAYVIVNEAGASVYSTSPLGREELPQYDATLRGAISIGRRLQDPLSELVKIDPASIGVGLYQHDVKAKHLRASLDAVVESCVNYVGVDLNSASPALLRYVSGLNQLTARRLYDHRTQNGPFKNRDQLKEVPGFGEATFVQAAGFLKITDGDHALDVTWIHPESYDAARKVLARLSRSEPDLAKKETASELGEQVKSLDMMALAEELQVGQLTLKDIVSQFARARARPARGPAGTDLQARHIEAGRFAAGDGAFRFGVERGGFRSVRRYWLTRQRAGAREPVGEPVCARPTRGGVGGRRCEGLGNGNRQNAAARFVDDDSAGDEEAGAAMEASEGAACGGAYRRRACADWRGTSAVGYSGGRAAARRSATTTGRAAVRRTARSRSASRGWAAATRAPAAGSTRGRWSARNTSTGGRTAGRSEAARRTGTSARSAAARRVSRWTERRTAAAHARV